MVGVLVVMAQVGGVPMPVVEIVDVVVVGDRLVAAVWAVLVAVSFGFGVTAAPDPRDQRRPDRCHEIPPDGDEDDRAARGRVGGIRDHDPAH